MKKIIFLIFFLFFSFVFIQPANALAGVIINEFSPSSTTEWVELLNPTAGSIDLTGYKISNGTTILKTLSDTIPKTGMLTFDLPSGSITDAGDCLVLLNPSDVGIYSISFGSGSCASGDHLAGVPTSTETAGITSGTTWAVITTPSKGWCNDSYGGCPTISSIVTAINSSGVTTNLGTQTDYSRITGLYFEKTGRGKIEFTNEMNFTDSDSLSWLSSLDTKLDLATTGKIALDADLIKNLVNTGATLTMYGLSLNDPEILVNGAADTGGIVSSLSYTKSTGTLVFNVAHFTTFTANEKSTSSGSSNNYNGSAPVCGDSKPLGLPDLFQINVTPKTAKLFFTPLDTTNNYYVSFSENPNAEAYGELVTLMREGVQSHTVYFLKPNTTYYFKVRGQNGCMPGDWSNILKVKTNNSIYYRYFSTTNLPISTTTTAKITSTKTQLSKNINSISPTITPSPIPTITTTNNQTTETLPSTPASKNCFLWWCW